MITFEQALTENEFHQGACTQVVGPRGGKAQPSTRRWRRNGKTETWKTRPGEFRIPVKYGLKGFGQITHWNHDDVHAACDCPLLKGEEL